MPRLALLSTSDKTGLVDLAKSLVEEFGFQLVSSGGTAKAIQAAGLPVAKVSDYTGSPEILGGRVKTLHPRIHGGILARCDLDQDVADLEANHIQPIELVVVNLYPFTETIAQPNVALADAIEQIDIGGLTLLRAAAKNHQFVTVLCNPDQYSSYLEDLRHHAGQPSLTFRQSAAQRAFWHTATYDQTIATYLSQAKVSEAQTNAQSEPKAALPKVFTLTGHQQQALRYGENPHQLASWYQTGPVLTGWSAATQLQGKELSYNNLVDLEAAWQTIAEFANTQPAVAILKHTNPCGVALAETLVEAYQLALQGDPVSAFGGIVALNRPLDQATAQAMTDLFLECVVAPGCDPAAAAVLQAKSRLRVLVLPSLDRPTQSQVKSIAGGFLVQTPDQGAVDPNQWQIVTQTAPTAEQLAELAFAWRVVRHVKSNGIVVSRKLATIGIGAGQMNRVGAVQIALNQAGEKAQDSVLASDAFFPFDDSVKLAAAAGVKAIVQPGGSLRDQDSIQAANDLKIAMVFTGIRHFLH